MSRPKPVILLSHTNSATYKCEQVLQAEAVYAVFYRGKPINIRSLNSLIDYPGPKYKKSAFPSKAHCVNLVDRLNKMFKTKDFAAFKLTGGEPVDESDE